MHDVPLVEVLGALKQLDKNLPGLGLRQLLLRDDPIEQLALGGELQDQEDPVRLVEGLLEAEHVRVADAHEDGDLLLEAFSLRALRVADAALELLDRVFEPARPLHAQVHRGEMALAELLEDAVAGVEGAGVPAARIPEHEACLVQDGDLVAVFQLPSLVPADELLLYEGAVDGQILKHGDDVPVSGLVEDQTVPVGDGRDVEDHVAFRMSSYEVPSGRESLVHLLGLVLRHILGELLFPTFPAFHSLPPDFEGLDRGRTESSSLHGQSMSHLGRGKQVAPCAVIIVQITFEVSWGVYILRQWLRVLRRGRECVKLGWRRGSNMTKLAWTTFWWTCSSLFERLSGGGLLSGQRGGEVVGLQRCLMRLTGVFL